MAEPALALVQSSPAPARAQIAFDKVALVLGGKAIIDTISLEVAAGEILCVVGASGCGKTTALRLAAGLYQPTGGAVRFEGEVMRAPRREIAVVFQDYGKALLPWRTAAGNVSLALETIGMPSAQRAARIAELLAKVGLAGHAAKYPTEMSGGMQQRLQIARCLAQDPKVLLMDEPFGALDEIVRDQLNEQLVKLWSQTRKTIVFVTHSIPEAVFLSSRIVVMSPRPGRIIDVIDCDFGAERTLDIRESPEFLKVAHRVREGLRAGHSYDE